MILELDLPSLRGLALDGREVDIDAGTAIGASDLSALRAVEVWRRLLVGEHPDSEPRVLFLAGTHVEDARSSIPRSRHPSTAVLDGESSELLGSSAALPPATAFALRFGAPTRIAIGWPTESLWGAFLAESA